MKHRTRITSCKHGAGVLHTWMHLRISHCGILLLLLSARSFHFLVIARSHCRCEIPLWGFNRVTLRARAYRRDASCSSSHKAGKSLSLNPETDGGAYRFPSSSLLASTPKGPARVALWTLVPRAIGYVVIP